MSETLIDSEVTHERQGLGERERPETMSFFKPLTRALPSVNLFPPQTVDMRPISLLSRRLDPLLLEPGFRLASRLGSEIDTPIVTPTRLRK